MRVPSSVRVRSQPEDELFKAMLADPVLNRFEFGFHIEHVFHPKRKWRFDFSFPARKLAFEVEGGVFSRGRHVRPAGFIGDCEKYNAAALLGWRVFRFPVKKNWLPEALATMRAALEIT